MHKRIGTHIAFFAVVASCLLFAKDLAFADEVATLETQIIGYENYLLESVELGKDINGGKITASWGLNDGAGQYAGNITTVGYELQLSSDKGFCETATKTCTISQAEAAVDNKYSFSVSDIGANGGTVYARIRAVGQIVSVPEAEAASHQVGELIYSAYVDAGQSYTYLKISDANFKGMTKLLKSGVNSKKAKYDSNKDGWLSQNELSGITELTNYKKPSKSVNKYSPAYSDASSQCAVTGFKGIENFKNLKSLKIVGYSQNKLDLSKSSVCTVELIKVASTGLTVDAPKAKSFFIRSDDMKNKLKEIDLSKCKSAVEVDAAGSFRKYAELKLPKNAKNLMRLSMLNIKGHVIDLNNYSNLLEFNLYSSQASKLKANKCKNLRYVYFYISSSIRNVDLSKCKKLKGVSAYLCAQLSSSKIKTKSSCKKSTGNGKWWYGTKDYKKNVEAPIKKALSN